VELVGERREYFDVADLREAEEIDVENEGFGGLVGRGRRGASAGV